MTTPMLEAPTPAVRRGPSWRGAFGEYGPPVLSFMAFIGIWYLLIAIMQPNERLFPPPHAVFGQLIEVYQQGDLMPAFTNSAKALGIGLGLAMAVGIILGLLIGMSRTGDLLAAPYLWAYFATPDIALAPLVIIWLGFGMGAKVWMIFFAASVPLMLACKEGIQSVDGSLVRAARSFGASRRKLFGMVIIPATMPFIGLGIRNAISRGFVGLLVVEMTVGTGGLGQEVMRAGRRFDAARMFAYIGVLVFIALVLIGMSKRFERYTARWREEVSL